MFLREFSLGNFKAFGPTQTLPLKPLTLIYGPNSGGKSSLIHGLLCASQVQRFHNPSGFGSISLDVHQTELGGDSVDLGGFEQFVFRRDISRRVTLGFGLADAPSPRQGDGPARSGRTTLEVEIGPPLTEEAKEGIELRVAGEPRVMAYRICRDGNPLVTFGLHGSELRLNQMAISSPEMADLVQELTAGLEGIGDSPRGTLDEWVLELMSAPGFFTYGDTLLPRGVTFREHPIMDAYTHAPVGAESGDDQSEPWVVIRDFLNDFLLHYHAAIANELSTLDYLGPLRTYPPRHITDMMQGEAAVHSEGSSSWQLLISDGDTRASVNGWLGRRMLSTPYELQVRRHFDGERLQENLLDEISRSLPATPPEEPIFSSEEVEIIAAECMPKAMSRMRPISELVMVDKRTDTRVTHRDIGIGVSQVLPVLVTAYANSGQIIAIEQPEIHLHPALQAELGDLFIESALKRQNTMILETHSEHLLLRVLRRIREKTEGKLPEGAPPITPEDVQVVFVEPTSKGSIVHDLPITPDGDFEKRWPGGFFAERAAELF